MKLLRILICFFVGFLSSVSASEAFYAISSLCFYLDDTKKESIKFENADIASLWEKASLDSFVSSKIKKARTLFYNEQNFTEANELLEEAWEQIRGNVISRPEKDHQYYPNFSDNPLLNEEMRNAIQPYLLSLKHPMKPMLDEIFNQSRAIENEEAFENAGFDSISKFMRVAKHPLLPGYLLKVFLDSEHRLNQVKRPGWLRLVDRCEGAMFIRKLIKKEKIQHFVVPDKKIYPLPPEPIPRLLPGKEQQLAVLLVTDMDLAEHELSREAWKTKITPEHLEELYTIISHGYASTYLATNIAYTNNGKFACIDTEFPQRKLNFDKVRHYLSEEMCVYWDELVKSGGRKSE